MVKLCEQCSFLYEDWLFELCPVCGSELVDHVGVGLCIEDGLKLSVGHPEQSSGKLYCIDNLTIELSGSV